MENLKLIFTIFLGLHTSVAYNETLCDDENFQDRTWTTQGRIDLTDSTPYPIDGEYTGVIPDTEGLCAKLYSDCNNPEIMFYTIFNCFNRSEVFEGKFLLMKKVLVFFCIVYMNLFSRT